MADKKCKKLGNRATKQERLEEHRIKMESKNLMREYNHKNSRKEFVFANISKNHEYYGDSPAEHEQRKNNS